MAAPITHIVLTNKIYNDFFRHFSKKNFFIGTSLPDIRYLKIIDRNSTHFKALTLGNFKNDNPFMAGAKFHSIVDEIREKYMVSQDIYLKLPKFKYITQSLKLLEDELLYENFDDWDNLVKDFNDIPYEQIRFDLKKPHIEKWYSLLQEYFAKNPSPQIRGRFIEKIGFTPEDAQKMNRFIDEFKNNQGIKNIILELYDKFYFLLNKFVIESED